MAYAGKRRFTDKSSDNLEGRVSAVETAVEHIEVGMIDIRDSIRGGFTELRGELDIQNENIKPKVVAWAGWAAVVLLVIGMFGSGYIRDLERIEKELDYSVKDSTIKHLEDSVLVSSHEERLRSLEREVFIKEVIVNGRNKKGTKREN